MMTKEDVERQIQEKLAAARQLLVEVSALADENDIEDIEFVGLKLEPHFGWFLDDSLELASEWNISDCVIGSKLAEGEWSSSSWCG